jgi:hypothetical protein
VNGLVPAYVVVDLNVPKDKRTFGKGIFVAKASRIGCRLWLEEFQAGLKMCVPKPKLAVRRASLKIYDK